MTGSRGRDTVRLLRMSRLAEVKAPGVARPLRACAVLYEMLTGRRAFEGEDISITLENVLKEEPTWEGLPGNLPGL